MLFLSELMELPTLTIVKLNTFSSKYSILNRQKKLYLEFDHLVVKEATSTELVLNPIYVLRLP